MFNYNYESIESKINNNLIIKIFGKIDINVLKNYESEEFAFYVLPLIERMVLELYKILPFKDIEYNSQGTMRTVLPILENDEEKILPDDIIETLKELYGPEGIRNKLLHVSDDNGTIILNVPIEKMLRLIDFLLNIIIEKYDLLDNLEFGKIERLN